MVTTMANGAATAADEDKYPTNWKGQWIRVVHRDVEVQGAFVQTKPWGLGQEAPLTPEYQKVHRDSMEDQKNGGLGNYPTARCLPSGMPRMMTFSTQEYVITRKPLFCCSPVRTTCAGFHDGRDWPKNPKPTYGGYSIGKWIDEDGDGRYDLLEVETRYFSKAPVPSTRAGCRLPSNNQSIFKERIYIDKANPNILHDVTTVIDNALTRPWTSDRQYRRLSQKPEQCRKTTVRKAMPTSSSARRTISCASTVC